MKPVEEERPSSRRRAFTLIALPRRSPGHRGQKGTSQITVRITGDNTTRDEKTYRLLIVR